MQQPNSLGAAMNLACTYERKQWRGQADLRRDYRTATACGSPTTVTRGTGRAISGPAPTGSTTTPFLNITKEEMVE